MKKIIIIFAGFFLLHAEQAIGKNDTRLGLGANVANLSVNDPDGDTGSDVATYLSGVMTMPINRNNPSVRWWYELKYRSLELDPSTTEIGQNVNSLSFSATAQKAWPSQTVGAYWVGMGAELSLDDYEDRLIIDQDGFLDQQYDARSEAALGLILNTGFNFKKTQSGYFIGVNINYHIPIDDGLEGISINTFLLW